MNIVTIIGIVREVPEPRKVGESLNLRVAVGVPRQSRKPGVETRYDVFYLVLWAQEAEAFVRDVRQGDLVWAQGPIQFKPTGVPRGGFWHQLNVDRWAVLADKDRPMDPYVYKARVAQEVAEL